MPFTVIAAVVVMGFFGVGPMMVDEDCGGSCSSESNVSVSKCDTLKVQDSMRKKKLPKELKVEVEGKLYTVPKDVKMVKPTPPPAARIKKWWKRFLREGKDSDDDAVVPTPSPGSTSERPDDISSSPSDSENGDSDSKAAAVDKDVRSAGEHSCQICFEHDHSTVMLPCGHGGLCWDCGLQIYAMTEECPMCRTKIELLVPLNGDVRRYEGEDEFVSSAVNCTEDGKPLVAASRPGSAALLPKKSSAAAMAEWS